MPLTVAAIESELLVRVGPYLARVGLDGTTAGGANAALRGPVRRAILAVGGSMADPITPSDADVAAVRGPALERLLDVAELRALENCWGNWPKVNFSAGGNSQELGDLSSRLEKRIASLQARTRGPYGPGDPSLPRPSATGIIKAGRCDSGDPWARPCPGPWPPKWGC
jgi:hypothetical protein